MVLFIIFNENVAEFEKCMPRLGLNDTYYYISQYIYLMLLFFLCRFIIRESSEGGVEASCFCTCNIVYKVTDARANKYSRKKTFSVCLYQFTDRVCMLISPIPDFVIICHRVYYNSLRLSVYK